MPKTSPPSITEVLAMHILESQDGSEFDEILSQVIKCEKLTTHKDRTLNFEAESLNEDPFL